MLRRRAGTVLGTVAVLVAATTGVAAAGPVTSPNAWVKQVCGAVVTWSAQLDATLQAATRTAPSAPTTAEARSTLEGTLGALADRTDGLVKTLTSAGRPKVNGGKAAASAVVTVFRTLAANLRTVRDDVKAAPVDAPATFTAAMTAANVHLEALLSAADLDVAKSAFRNPALTKAAAAETACRAVVAG